MILTILPSQPLLIGAKVTGSDLGPDLRVLSESSLQRNKGRQLSLLLFACVAQGAETVSLCRKPTVFPCTVSSVMATLKAV